MALWACTPPRERRKGMRRVRSAVRRMRDCETGGNTIDLGGGLVG